MMYCIRLAASPNSLLRLREASTWFLKLAPKLPATLTIRQATATILVLTLWALSLTTLVLWTLRLGEWELWMLRFEALALWALRVEALLSLHSPQSQQLAFRSKEQASRSTRPKSGPVQFVVPQGSGVWTPTLFVPARAMSVL
jgi:hypothetical protein